MVKQIFTLLLVLYPILSAYIIFDPLDLGLALCVVIGGIAYITTKNKNKFKWPSGYFVFLIYVVLATVFVTQAIPIRVLFYTILLMIGCVICDFNSLYRYYKTVAIICIVFFILQEFIRIGTGVNIPGIFTFLPTLYGESATFIENNIIDNNRSSSFFLEPSYFAQYLFPLLVIDLFYNSGRNHIKKAIILTIITFSIRSGNGILLLGLIWSIWLFYSDVKRSTKRKILVIGFIGTVALLFFNPDIVLELTARAKELSLQGVNEKYLSSGFIRFFRGYYLYFSLPFLNRLFGVNPIILDSYKQSDALGLFEVNSSFLNGTQTLLCLYGAIGFILFFRHLYLSYKKAPTVCMVLLIGVVYLLFSESYFISSRMLLTMILIYQIKIHNENFISN